MCDDPCVAPKKSGAMHVAKVVRPYKDREYVYHFVRQSYREDGRVKHRTLANLSHLPSPVIELVRRALARDPAPRWPPRTGPWRSAPACPTATWRRSWAWPAGWGSRRCWGLVRVGHRRW